MVEKRLSHSGRLFKVAEGDLLLSLAQLDQIGRNGHRQRCSCSLQQLDLVFEGLDAQPALRTWATALLAPEFERLGWLPAAGENSEAGTLRAQLLTQLARFGYPPALAGAQERFAAALVDDTSRVPPALRGPVLVAAARQGGPAAFETLLSALRQADSPRERAVLLSAAGATADATLIRRLLDEAVAGTTAPDVSFRIPAVVAASPAMGPMAYDFTVANWAALAKLAGTNVFSGQQWLLPRAAGWASDPVFADRLLADQQRLLGAAGASNAEREATMIRARHRLREREAGRLVGALKALPER